MSKGKQGGPYPPLKEWAVTTFSLSEFHLNSILSKCCEKTQDPIEWLDVEDLSYLVHALEKFPWNHKLDATILKWILLPKKDNFFWDMRTFYMVNYYIKITIFFGPNVLIFHEHEFNRNFKILSFISLLKHWCSCRRALKLL